MASTPPTIHSPAIAVRSFKITNSAAVNTAYQAPGTSATLSRRQAHASSPQVSNLPHQAIAGSDTSRDSQPKVQ